MTIFSLDSNILVYAVDPKDEVKHHIAKQLLAQALEERCCIATQVLGEFYNVVTRKQYASREQAVQIITQWTELMEPVASSPEAFSKALAHVARTGTQFWDALILATCAEHGVTKLYTEDIGAQCRRGTGVMVA